MNGFLVFLLLLNAYIVVVYLVYRSKKLAGKIELVGPMIMWKTQRGKKTIDKIAAVSPKWWNRWGDLAIWVTWIAGFLILALLIDQLALTLLKPVEVAKSTPAPQYLLGLPGVNPLIPIGYGIVGLVIALVVHEGSHAILARSGDLKVKSLGLLFFIVPIGAFVEPDEKDLEAASARKKNRVFAAGPMANIALALVAGILFSTVFMSAVHVANDGKGVGIASVVPGEPASAAQVPAGSVLVSIDGTPMPNLTAFNDYLAAKKPGDVVALQTLVDGHAQPVRSVKLTDKYDYVERVAPASNNASFHGKAFMGVTSVDLATVKRFESPLAHPFEDGIQSFNLHSGGSFLWYTSYPFIAFFGLDVLGEPYRHFLVVEGPMAFLPTTAFFVLANALYWVFWLDLMLGTFNALPAGPLDGGQMLKATLKDWFMRRYGVDRSKLTIEHEIGVPGARVAASDAETQLKLDRVNAAVKRATWSLGFFILGLILLPIVMGQIGKFL